MESDEVNRDPSTAETFVVEISKQAGRAATWRAAIGTTETDQPGGTVKLIIDRNVPKDVANTSLLWIEGGPLFDGQIEQIPPTPQPNN